MNVIKTLYLALLSANAVSILDSVENIMSLTAGKGGLLSKNAVKAMDYFALKSVSFSSSKVKSRVIPIRINSLETVHFLDFEGSGSLPPIILIHGISSCAADYYPIIRKFQSECKRVIALDLPGHGLSSAHSTMSFEELENRMVEAVERCAEECQISKTEQCIVLGNSLGGFVACRFTVKNPTLVCALALVSPAGAPLTPEELIEMKKLFQMETLKDAATFVETVLGRPRFPLSLFGVRHAIGWFCRERAKQPSVLRILNEATIKSRLRTHELKKIRCPVLLIWGKKESVFSERHLKWFMNEIPGHLFNLFRPETIGHIPHLDAALVCGAVASFCQLHIKNRKK